MVVEPPGFFVPEGARHSEHDWSHAATGAKFPPVCGATFHGGRLESRVAGPSKQG